jgi:predicted AlkP superfamily pyrophosphatase or phosphodiesterase
MKRTAVLNVVGLSRSLIGTMTPHIAEFARSGCLVPIEPAFPAVTCTAQANYLTGLNPSRHGIVGNGWYDRELAEVHFWKQSNHLVQAPKLWTALRAQSPKFTCAQLFWWYNMYAGVDYSITPRPIYPADGRKIFDIYTWPYSFRPEIKAELGEFPFPAFWGPAAGVHSSRFSSNAASEWIAAAARWTEHKHAPTLSLVYLPHLDYNLQRLGPKHPELGRDLMDIDRIVGELIRFFQERSVQILLLSEYGISAVERPIHLNRLFRKRGWITIKEELGLELLDYGASRVFAVADHQVAHVYVNDPRLLGNVQAMLAELSGIKRVLDGPAKAAAGLDHPRAGDLVVEAETNAWFTYYYWLEDARAPDFARTVDIHRKPGYDPVELFLDPAQRWMKAKVAWRLAQKKLGFRMLMDVVPLDAALVRGSHGGIPREPSEHPLVILARSDLIEPQKALPSTAVSELIRHLVAN